MTILASFNYTEPSFGVVLTGTLAAALMLLIVGWMRRVVLGFFAGAVGGVTIAWIVLGQGSGDVWLVHVVGTPVAGLAGAVLGAVAGFVGKFIRRKEK